MQPGQGPGCGEVTASQHVRSGYRRGLLVEWFAVVAVKEAGSVDGGDVWGIPAIGEQDGRDRNGSGRVEELLYRCLPENVAVAGREHTAGSGFDNDPP
jgi:hypothetical protein